MRWRGPSYMAWPCPSLPGGTHAGHTHTHTPTVGRGRALGAGPSGQGPRGRASGARRRRTPSCPDGGALPTGEPCPDGSPATQTPARAHIVPHRHPAAAVCCPPRVVRRGISCLVELRGRLGPAGWPLEPPKPSFPPAAASGSVRPSVRPSSVSPSVSPSLHSVHSSRCAPPRALRRTGGHTLSRPHTRTHTSTALAAARHLRHLRHPRHLRYPLPLSASVATARRRRRGGDGEAAPLRRRRTSSTSRRRWQGPGPGSPSTAP